MNATGKEDGAGVRCCRLTEGQGGLTNKVISEQRL